MPTHLFPSVKALKIIIARLNTVKSRIFGLILQREVNLFQGITLHCHTTHSVMSRKKRKQRPLPANAPIPEAMIQQILTGGTKTELNEQQKLLFVGFDYVFFNLLMFLEYTSRL